MTEPTELFHKSDHNLPWEKTSALLVILGNLSLPPVNQTIREHRSNLPPSALDNLGQNA